MNKKILGLSILAGALGLSSCGKNEQVQEPRIVKECVGLVCSLAIEDDTLNRYTNLIGRTVDRVVKRTQLRGAQDSVVWTIPGGGDLASNTQLMQRGLLPCIDDGCSLNSNPTGWVFASTDPQTISVSGTVVNSDGTTREINIHTPVTLEIGEPVVTITKDNAGELAYTFTADPADTGIPEDATYTWFVDGAQLSEEGLNVKYTFPIAGTDFEVKLVVSSDDLAEDIIVTNTITSGAIPPTIVQNSVNGRSVTLTADTTDTGLPGGTAFTWTVAGQSVTGVGNPVTLELPSYNTNYNITVQATAPGATTGIGSQPFTVKTGFGTPSFTQSIIGGSGLDYSFTADLGDTGVPETATFNWYVNGDSIGSGKTITHIFENQQTQYTVKLDTLVNGQSVGTFEKTIETGITEQPTLSVTNGATPKTRTVVADISNTPIDGSWTKQWLIDGNVIPEATDTSLTNHVFDDFNSSYQVSFVATKGNITREATTTVTTDFGTPAITSEVIDGTGLDYRFTANTENTGIPDTATFTWKLADGTDLGTGKTIEHIFNEAGTYTVKLTVTVNGVTLPELSTDITTGTADQPSLTVSDGSSPKERIITADTTGTVIQANWTKQWFVDGVEQTGETTTTLTKEFNDFGTDYTVRFVATSPDGSLTREQTITATTGYGTPSIGNPVSTPNVDFGFTFTADTTGTGLPSDAVFEWSGGTTEVTGNPADLVFAQPNTEYTVTLTVKSSAGVVLATNTATVTTLELVQPTISSNIGSNPRQVELTADLTGTGVDDTWEKQWYVGDTPISGATADTLIHMFDLTSTDYSVKFTATKEGRVRTATASVRTGDVVLPSFTLVADSSDSTGLTYTIDTNTAKFQNSGLTSAWQLTFTVTGGSQSIDPVTVNQGTTASIIFKEYNTIYTIVMSATPPAGSGISAPSAVNVVQDPIVKPVLYASSVTYQIPTNTTIDTTRANTYLSRLSIGDAGLASVVVNGSTITFNCKPGYYISDAARDLSPGNVAINDGPGGETPANSILWISNDIIFGYSPLEVFNNMFGFETSLGCWELST